MRPVKKGCGKENKDLLKEIVDICQTFAHTFPPTQCQLRPKQILHSSLQS